MQRRILGVIAALARSLTLGVLQLGGLAVVAVGFYLLAPWLGVVVLGLVMCLAGWVLDGDS